MATNGRRGRVLLLAVAASLISLVGCGREKKKEAEKPAQSIDALRQQLEKILQDTHMPGLSVAIVHRDGPEWMAGLGKADVATGRAATADTLFRIGSVSKAFVSLSILKLADQGKLSLHDPVRKLAPEVWFENRWEATDPIRVVHLLEHTTGWDDMHLAEYAKDAAGMSLRDGLDYYHHSRISRWRPGTRMSYCNSGPAVAAYIVEKITGQRFEDYVQQNLFQPIGMKMATYFRPPPESTTVLYHDDGKTPYLYWNILLRPAGSINASARDMAAYAQFYLNRGVVNGVPVVPSADIDRMEIPASSWAAREGMKTGYGLSNYWTVQDGFVYHGHNGGVNGGITVLAYMADLDAAYFFSTNSANIDALRRIDKAVRGYVTRQLQKPAVPAPAPVPANAEEYAGWYEPDSPRNEMTHFLERVAGITLIRFRDGKLLANSVETWNDAYVPVAGAQFRHIPKDSKDAPSPVPTLILLAPNAEGTFYEAYTSTMKRIPAWLAIAEILLVALFLLSIVSIVLYAPFWMLGGLSKKRRRPAERAMRIWPLVAVLSLLAAVALLNFSGDALADFGNLTVWSVGFCAATVVFALASLASAIALWRAPSEGVRRVVRWYSTIVTAALLVATAYLAYWGVIGFRSWA